MNNSQDIPLKFHESLNDLLDSFRNVIASLTWLKVSGAQAEQFFSPYPYVIELSCTVSDKLIKIDKSIFTLINNEGFNKETPLYSSTLINFYRVMTIALKDIVWAESDFSPLLHRDELQFLRHIRNASAHQNRFFFGLGAQRSRALGQLPVTWRNKVISDAMEGTLLYMDFMSPGDLFFLLADISLLAARGAP